MEYPQLNKNPGGKIELKDFTGGINTARNPLLLQDDQVPEVENMVPFRGILTTRRKFVLDEQPDEVDAPLEIEKTLSCSLNLYTSGEEPSGVPICSALFDLVTVGANGEIGFDYEAITLHCSFSDTADDVENYIQDEEYTLSEYDYDEEGGESVYTLIEGTHEFRDAKFVKMVINEDEIYNDEGTGEEYSARHTDVIIQATLNGDINLIRIFVSYRRNIGGTYEPVFGYIIENEKAAYVPTVITAKSIDGTSATPLEDFNLLTPAFKEEFFPRLQIVLAGVSVYDTLYPFNTTTRTPYIPLHLSQNQLDEDANREMICEMYGVFDLYVDTGLELNPITTSYYAKARIKHSENIESVYFDFYDGDGYKIRGISARNAAVLFNMNLANGTGYIRFDFNGTVAHQSEWDAYWFFDNCYIEKIVLTARKKNPMYQTLTEAKAFELVNTNITTLYGGTRSGIADGTRRFYAGYPEGNLIRWSGLNDDTYLPENNFAYVGDDADITALGKQYGALIVFKENSTYNMEYTYSVEDGATTVLFPITPISNEYGCDNPGTLQLVNDRLVWCNTNGRVYILYSQYQYTRKNIADIGGNVYDLLKDNPPTFAAVWDKMYFLFSSVESGGSYVNRAIIWDFDQTTYYNYYSNEKSQDRLSWFYWDITEITEQLTAAQTFEDVLYLNGANYYELSEDLMDTCSIKTKEFDFGVPTQLKNIRRVDIMAEIIEAQTVQVDYFGDNGTILYSDYRAISEIGNVVIKLRPHILRLRTFSVRITGTKLSVQGIIITADTAGRLR